MAAVLARARELRLAGLADVSAGRAARAARTLRAALDLLPGDGSGPPEVVEVRVSCLLTLALAEAAARGPAAAGPRLAEAFSLAGDDPCLVARCRCQRGVLLLRSGDFAGARADLTAAGSAAACFTLRERAVIGVNLGVIAFELGRPAEADAADTEAVELAAAADDPQLLFMAQHNQGYHRYLSGDLPGALDSMAAAEQSPADVFRGTSLFDLARVLGEAGLLDQALEALDRAAAVCRPRVDRMLRAEIERERAVLLRLAGELDAAARAARSARARFRRLGVSGPAAVASLIALDCDLGRGRRLPAVLRGATAVEAVARSLGDTDLVARSITVTAEAASRLVQPDLAGAALRRYPPDSHGLVLHLRHAYAAALAAEAAGRSPRRLLVGAAADLAASRAVSSSLDSRAARKVLALRLEALDVGRAVRRGPTEVLAALERWSSLGLPPVRPPADPRQARLVERLRSLSQALRGEPDDPRAGEWREEGARLRRELTGLALAQPQDGVAGDALPTLGEGLAGLRAADRDLLRLFGHDGGLWAVAVVAGRRRLARLADLAAVLEPARRVGADLRVLAGLPAGPLRDAVASSLADGLRRLDEVLVRPWRLRGAGLVVVGTHAVASVPWGMLPSLAGVPVTVARSVPEWAARRVVAVRPQVRALSGPGLQHARAEASAVAAAWGGAGPVRDARAGDLVAALGSADAVHVAAHGRHQPASPLFSSLRMADGDVFAHELPAGRVHAGHVVLSACEVGAAEVRPGDEPLGLAHTLLALGVGCVVASVAPVPDEVSAAVMAAYHRGLAAGLASDEALAAAGAAVPFVALGSSWRAVT